jgi:hypothetical protein
MTSSFMHQLSVIRIRNTIGIRIKLVSMGSIVVFSLYESQTISSNKIKMAAKPIMARVSNRIVSIF